MDIRLAALDTCSTASGAVVVIDVIRAFTTAAFAFAANARDIVLVSSVDEALALRQRFSGALVMGEVGGLPPPEFDLGNSPAALLGQNLQGRRLIQRTSAGTQGIVRCANAPILLAASFVCAGPTVQYIRERAPDAVTLVCTSANGEDQACADYMTALLRHETPDAAALLKRVREAGRQRIDVWRDPASARQRAEFEADLECCAALDRFNFAMVVQRQAGLLVMRPVSPLAK